MASIKKNFGYNLILTFCNYLFPLLTYPYVSRVLGVDKIGICNFVDGIINYFVIFSAMGISIYGIREIAKCRDNAEHRNFVFSNLIVMNIGGTIVSLIVLIMATLWLPSFQSYKEFLWFGAVKLLFNMFLIEWFFQGIQEFKYITIRSVMVRFLFVISVFLFVHTKEDAILYYGLIVCTTIINAIVNWNYSRKYRQLSFRKLNIRLFMVPVLVFGYYQILTSMYTSFNLVFLGFVSGDIEVGYFSTATKLYTILMGVFTAFTTVMVPKVSELLASGEKEQLQMIANKTFSLLSILSLPIIIFCLFCADDIILILSGPGYEGAYTPFRIVIFLLLIIGIEQIVIQQYLMASTSNKAVFSVSTTGALVGLSLNIILTPHFGAVGSAISWGISEFSVLLVGLHLLRKVMGITLQIQRLFKSILWSLLYVLPLVIIFCFHLEKWTNLVVSGLSVVLVFMLINMKWNKNEYVIQTVNRFIKK